MGDVIDAAVMAALKDPASLKAYSVSEFVPFDPVSKRTKATAADASGKTVTVAKGAPQAIVALAKSGQRSCRQGRCFGCGFGIARISGARRGAIRGRGQDLDVAGHPADVRSTTRRFQADHRTRASQGRGGQDGHRRRYRYCSGNGRQLGLGDQIIPAAEAFPKDMDPDHVPEAIADSIVKADGFARVCPRSINMPSSRRCRTVGTW